MNQKEIMEEFDKIAEKNDYKIGLINIVRLADSDQWFVCSNINDPNISIAHCQMAIMQFKSELKEDLKKEQAP